MNRIERLAAILLLLQEQPRTSSEIARHFEVSRRTVLRDVQALSEMGVPIIAQEGPGGGYSLPASYHLEPLPLTGNEVFLLMLALSGLESLSDLPFREERASLLAKLRAGLPPSGLSGAEQLLKAVGVDRPPPARPAPFLEPLLAAAQAGQWLKSVYQSSERTTTQHLLPLRVYSRAGLWYCRAYAQDRQAERTYRVDRFLSLSPPDPAFQPTPPTEPVPYGHESHPLVLARLSARGASRVESEPDLAPQLQRLPDGSARLAFHCPPTELAYYARFFASLGPEVEVDGPPELRQRLCELGQLLVHQYSNLA